MLAARCWSDADFLWSTAGTNGPSVARGCLIGGYANLVAYLLDDRNIAVNYLLSTSKKKQMQFLCLCAPKILRANDHMLQPAEVHALQVILLYCTMKLADESNC